MSVAYFLLCYVHYGVGRIGKPAEFYNSVFRFRNMETSDTSFSVPCVCIKREREGGKKEREKKNAQVSKDAVALSGFMLTLAKKRIKVGFSR